MSKVFFFLAGFLLVACCVSAASFPGGFQDVDVDDEGVKTAAHEASRALSKNFASKFHHKLAKILKARQQIVAGTDYRMEIVVGVTRCTKDEMEFDEVKEQCTFTDSLSTYKQCTIIVYRNLKGEHKLVTSGCVLISKDDF